jgi:hypothetical protein
MMTIALRITAAAALLLLGLPNLAGAQTAGVHSDDNKFSLQASVGPTMIDGGHSLSAGVGYSPTPKLTFVLIAERDHLNYRDNGSSRFRGGTMLFVGGEVRFEPLTGKAVSPFVTAGLGAGIGRPNVAPGFEDRVTNSVRTQFVGGGISVPLSQDVSVVAEARFMLVHERDSVAGLFPIRAGIAWRF